MFDKAKAHFQKCGARYAAALGAGAALAAPSLALADTSSVVTAITGANGFGGVGDDIVGGLAAIVPVVMPVVAAGLVISVLIRWGKKLMH